MHNIESTVLSEILLLRFFMTRHNNKFSLSNENVSVMASAKERLRQHCDAVLTYCNSLSGKEDTGKEVAPLFCCVRTNVVAKFCFLAVVRARMSEEASEEDAFVVECSNGEKARYG